MTENSKSAWGKILLEYGTPTVNQGMTTLLKTMGYVKEGSLSLEQEEGTKLQLFAEGHVLLDELQLEGVVKLKGTIIQIPETVRQEFWNTETNAGKMSVKSMVTSNKYSVKLTSEVEGSDTFEAPYCSINFGLAYSSTEGWSAPFTITVLKGKSGKLFEIGKSDGIITID